MPSLHGGEARARGWGPGPTGAAAFLPWEPLWPHLDPQPRPPAQEHPALPALSPGSRVPGHAGASPPRGPWTGHSMEREGGGAGKVAKAWPSGPLADRMSPVVGDARRPCSLASHLRTSSGGARGTS